MSLARRVIPTILVRGHHAVKGERFNSWRRVGSAIQAVKVFETRQVDELIILDIEATPEGRGPNIALIEELAADCFMPLTVGGGVRTIEDIRALLKAGADKVAIGTAAFDNSNFIREAAEKFGCQCITVSLDVKDRTAYARCGTQFIGFDPASWAVIFESYGAGEILLNNIDRDGTMEGYDLDLIRSVSSAVDIPVIASGGARDYDDFLAAFHAGAHAVAASAMFQFTDQTPAMAKRHLSEHGVRVRL